MKKSILALGLALLLLATSPVVAMAATELTGTSQTEVTYTYADLGDQTPGNEIGSYEINIPATYDAAYEPRISITAQNVNIGNDKLLAVFLDGQSTFDSDGIFYMAHTQNPAIRVTCTLERTDLYRLTTERITSMGDTLVAAFENGRDDPIYYGYITATPCAYEDTINGTYTGTLYFKIGIKDK